MFFWCLVYCVYLMYLFGVLQCLFSVYLVYVQCLLFDVCFGICLVFVLVFVQFLFGICLMFFCYLFSVCLVFVYNICFGICLVFIQCLFCVYLVFILCLFCVWFVFVLFLQWVGIFVQQVMVRYFCFWEFISLQFVLYVKWQIVEKEKLLWLQIMFLCLGVGNGGQVFIVVIDNEGLYYYNFLLVKEVLIFILKIIINYV